MIERYFRLTENQTTVRREFLGGVTTFITMAYIVVVNPQILAQAGMPVEGVVFATCVASAAATLVMGLYANYPIALAPGMSLNAYFTYSVCLGMHVPWQTALGVIFFSGIFFLVLTVTRVREQIVNGIPACLKFSTAGGIGFVGDMDRYFRAVDVKSGKVLWETRLGTSVQGFPLTFSVGGKQYIAVSTGLGGGSPRMVPGVLAPEVHYPSNGNALYVFALPDRR